jgi:hypothetical protein
MSESKFVEGKKIKCRLSKISNQEKHFNANNEYYYLFAENTHYLFTKSQMEVAKERALKNPEDLLEHKPNIFKRVWCWVVQ